MNIEFGSADRDDCIRLLDHGCSGFCDIYILISTGLRCVFTI